MGRRGGRKLPKHAADAILRRLFWERAEPWPADKVERFSSLSPERRVALGLEPVERRRSEIAIRICSNPYCRHWTSTRRKHCQVCHQPQKR